MKDAVIISGQAEQDQMWMAWDDWFEGSDEEAIIDLIESIEAPGGWRLSRRRRWVVRSMALHMIRELALRNHARGEE